MLFLISFRFFGSSSRSTYVKGIQLLTPHRRSRDTLFPSPFTSSTGLYNEFTYIFSRRATPAAAVSTIFSMHVLDIFFVTFFLPHVPKIRWLLQRILKPRFFFFSSHPYPMDLQSRDAILAFFPSCIAFMRPGSLSWLCRRLNPVSYRRTGDR